MLLHIILVSVSYVPLTENRSVFLDIDECTSVRVSASYILAGCESYPECCSGHCLAAGLVDVKDVGYAGKRT